MSYSDDIERRPQVRGPKIGQGINISYLSISLLLILFPILDITSTEILLHHGRSTGYELNPVVANLHGEGSVWWLRAATLGLIVGALLVSRLKNSDADRIKSFSSMDILFGKMKGIGTASQLKICIFLIVALFSVSRLFAAISNVSGELFGASIPALADAILAPNQSHLIYTFTIIMSVSMSALLISLFWECYRRK